MANSNGSTTEQKKNGISSDFIPLKTWKISKNILAENFLGFLFNRIKKIPELSHPRYKKNKIDRLSFYWTKEENYSDTWMLEWAYKKIFQKKAMKIQWIRIVVVMIINWFTWEKNKIKKKDKQTSCGEIKCHDHNHHHHQ